MGTDLSINLFKSNKYLIEIHSYYDLSNKFYLFSMGNYLYIRDTLILNDIYYKYSLILLKKKNELFPVKVFPWMKNTKFISYSRSNFKNEYNIHSDNLFNYYKPLICKNSYKKHKLFYRKYELGDFSLELIRENIYLCKIDNVVISEGKFSFDGNYINFQNNYPQFTFKGYVDENSVCISFMPFNNACFPK
jgi:hypothetical protein